MRCGSLSYEPGPAGAPLRVVGMTAIMRMMVMVMTIAVTIAIVVAVLGIVCISIIVLMIVVLVLTLEGKEGVITPPQQRPLTFQQLSHLLLLSLFQIHARLGVAAICSFALLQLFKLLAFELLELARVVTA
ncbi:MAG TPA: hypothetical protein VI685_19420 [Candidatus Angelobacter sp.]